jgi:hypothetical protein
MSGLTERSSQRATPSHPGGKACCKDIAREKQMASDIFSYIALSRNYVTLLFR